MTPDQPASAFIPGIALLERRALIAGATVLVLSIIGGLWRPTMFFEGYLIGYVLCLGVTLGCLALGMVHRLTGGAWGVVIRQPISAASRVLPVMALLFVPVLIGMRHLYPWTDPAVVAGDEVLNAKRLYLNVPFFVARAVLYFVVWIGIARSLDVWSRERD